MRSHPARLNAKKRDGGELTAAEIEDFVGGVVDGAVGDAQLGAFLMAVCCRGMTVAETSALTRVMRDSGRVLELPSVPRPRVDKHSTGGVGDKVSLLLAPWVAAAGVPVPMISGRGLGHTGGTIDKLAAIPGYRTDLDAAELEAVVAECGFAMAGASAEIAPADRRMYAVRDVTGTVESIPLITASILSKKLAEGIDGLVMDVKCGRAAFMRKRADAEALMDSLVHTGRAAGVTVVALLTAMDQPLGRAVGNALEVAEIVACVRGEGPADLLEVTEALAAEMVVLGGKADDLDQARSRLHELLVSGAVEERLAANIRRQGGDPMVLRQPSRLPTAPVQVEVPAPRGGYVIDVDALEVGLAAMDLGAGRRQPQDEIDPAVGVVLRCTVGDAIAEGDPLAAIHARDAESARTAAARIAPAFVLGEDRPPPASRILARRA